MYTDVPTFRRCCFCIPLRYGLLVWGYLKMVPLSLMGVIVMVELQRMSRRNWPYTELFIIYIFVAIMLVMDFIFNIILVIAAHKKSYKLLRIFHFYNMTELAIFISVTLFDIYNKLYWFIEGQLYSYYHSVWFYYIEMFIFEISLLFICFYIVLLVKSELKKLENENACCNFVNNEAEARCVIVAEEPKDVVVAA